MEEIEFLVTVPPDDAETREWDVMDDTSRSGGKGVFRGPTSRSRIDSNEATIESRSIPVGVLKENLARVSQSVMQVQSDIRQIGDFKLKEVQLQVEVTAEGGVQFIGTSKVGGKGAITLTFGG